MALRVDDLLLLAELVRAGSLSATARQLVLPKATLSRRLVALEAAVGSKLFVPGARRLQLTEFGQELAERATRHRDEIDDTRRWIGAHDTQPRGKLRISVPADFAVLLMAETMARFVHRYPDLKLEIDTSPRRVDLINEPYDLAIRIGPLEDSTLVARRLMLLERGLFASPVYLDGRSLPRTPAELKDHAFVMLTQATGYVQRLSRGKRSVELQFAGSLQCNSIALTRALVLAGGGIGSFPHGMVRAELEAGRLVPLLPQWRFEPLQVSLLTAGRKMLPAKTRLFIEHLMATAPMWSL
jgi:DNA-binding transcriptional LysR family regulator